MTTIIVLTAEEMALLSPTEERVYRRYRHEGKKFAEIAKEFKISMETVRKRWNAAMKKIRAHRELVENPQYFIAKGRDVLRGEGSGMAMISAPAESLHTIPDLPEGTQDVSSVRLFEVGLRVQLRGSQELVIDGISQEVLLEGIEGMIDEVFEGADPPYCVVSFTLDGIELQAGIPFDMLEVL